MVGSAATNNYFGTAGQRGNVREWKRRGDFPARRAGCAGGSWYYFGEGLLLASGRGNDVPSNEGNDVGFRVASSIAAVPEPTSMLLSMVPAA